MPNFAIDGQSPSQISQTGTDDALVRNTGSSSVYLDAYSSVSSANYGLELQPLDSVNWAQGRDLWAVCAPGQESTLSTLYGADGVSLGAVSAVVTGDVTATIDGPVDANITNAVIPVTGDVTATIDNAVIPVTGTVDANITNASLDVTGTVNANITNAEIDAHINGDVVVTSGTVNVGGILTPVDVQGGGVILYNQSVNVAANSSTTINIPAPANGRTFYGIDMSWEILTSSGTTFSTVDVYTNGFPGTPIRGAAVRVVGDALEIGELGLPHIINGSFPMKSAFPLRVQMRNYNTTNAMTGFLRITGTAYAAPYPVDSGTSFMGAGVPTVSVTDPPSLSYITIPGSFSTNIYRIQPFTAGLDQCRVSMFDTAGPGWSDIYTKVSHSPYYSQSGAAAAFDMIEFSIPPLGLPSRLHFNPGSFTGTLRLTLAEVKR